MLAEYEAPPLDPSVDEALRAYIERKKASAAGHELLSAGRINENIATFDGANR